MTLIIKENLSLGNWENHITQTQPSYGVVARTWNQPGQIGGRLVLSTRTASPLHRKGLT